MLVTVVQHAEKERSPGDPGLTERGRRQAQRIADALAGTPVDVFRSSPLRRARETAAPLAQRLRRAPVLDERLLERMNWDGTIPLEDFAADWDATTSDRDAAPRLGDSSRAAGERFASLIRELGREPGQGAVLVAHGGVTVDGLRTLFGDEEVERRFRSWRNGPSPGAFTRIEVAGGGIRLLGADDIAHLSPAS